MIIMNENNKFLNISNRKYKIYEILIQFTSLFHFFYLYFFNTDRLTKLSVIWLLIGILGILNLFNLIKEKSKQRKK